jgi:peroxiredoxin
VDLADATKGRAVLFFYPAATGRPDAPEGWDLIPGARGCTAQNCAYRDGYGEFRALGVEVYGVSAQPVEEQRDFAGRMHIPFELLNDSGFELIHALRLPTFELHGRRYVKRLALVAARGRIEKVFYPVFPADRNAAVVLEYLRSR